MAGGLNTAWSFFGQFRLPHLLIRLVRLTNTRTVAGTLYKINCWRRSIHRDQKRACPWQQCAATSGHCGFRRTPYYVLSQQLGKHNCPSLELEPQRFNVLYHIWGVLVQATIQLVRDPGSHERSAIAASLIEFNASRIGHPTEDKLLVLTVTEPKTGNIKGGLWGSTIHDHLHVDLLVVPEALRHGGIGRRLMALAEQEAIDRGCRGAWLTTHSFQARGFYERLGYEAFGIMDDFPPGHSFIFLRKRFETPGDLAL